MIFITSTNNCEINSIIRNLKIKNGGVDNINSKIIIYLPNYLTEPLVHLINLSIEKSYWPDALKRVDIKPIHKTNENYLVNNYRPISLISNTATIFETVSYKQIHLLKTTMYFQKNNSDS